MKRIFFIIVNIILILGIILICTLYFPYGFIYSLGIFLPILIIIDILKYVHHIQKYPLNNYNEYKFKVLQDEFTDYDKNNHIYYIKVRYNRGIYTTISGNKTLRFDMNKCIFAKCYLRAYFIRNIHFLIVNKNKLKLNKLSRSLKVDSKFPYQNLKIIFINDSKSKEYWLIKNGKTKLNVIIADIIGQPYAPFTGTSRFNSKSYTHINVSEKHYVNIKNSYK